MVIKYLSALLALVFTLSFSSCSVDSDPKEGETTANEVTYAAETEAIDSTNVLDLFKSIDYENSAFKIWTSNVINSSLNLRQAPDDHMDGERINDALYTRDRLIEQKYNVIFEYTLVEPDAEFQLFNKASKVILAGDDAIDLIFGNMQVYAINFITNKLILNMNNIEEIDLSKEWWQQTAVRDLKVGNAMLLATGDITPRYVFSTFIMLFNQKLFSDRNIEFPYKAVDDGKWTMDMMLNTVKDTLTDLDGNGKYDINDFYGMTNEGWAYPFYNGFNETVLSIGSGEAVLSCETESAYDKLSKISELFALRDVFSKNITTQYDFSDIFESDQALLCSQTATNLYLLTDMESDFGVLPLPKYDETQDKYYSFVNGYCATAVMIPISVADKSRAGTLTEATAALSRYTVTPAAYEVTLLTKQTRDEESVEMLKLAAEGAMYDMSGFFGWGGLQNSLNGLMLQGKTTFASSIAKVKENSLKQANESLILFQGIE
ncbi:MAG: type 2 periplasmic-binding domain-containing protein [Eubacteriales bacterium]